MALETFGTETAEQINHAAILCHDLVLHEGFDVAMGSFRVGVAGQWSVFPSKLDGKDAIEIRIAVG